STGELRIGSASGREQHDESEPGDHHRTQRVHPTPLERAPSERASRSFVSTAIHTSILTLGGRCTRRHRKGFGHSTGRPISGEPLGAVPDAKAALLPGRYTPGS